MKMINNKFAILILAAVMTSCEFLTEKPETTFTNEQVFSNEQGVQSVLSGCYQAFTDYAYKTANFYELSANSAFLASKANVAGIPAMQVGRIHDTHNALNEKIFESMWKVLTRTNDLLYYIVDSPIDNKVKEEIIGQAHFVRAYAYFDLVRMYGRMPKVTTPVTTFDESNMPRASLREIYELILADLTVAEEKMPSKAEQDWPGRPHKMAATAVKAKVYLQMASLKTEHYEATKEPEADRYTEEEKMEFYRQADIAAGDVMESGDYILLPKLSELWNNNSKNSEESIFELQYGVYGQVVRTVEKTLCGSISVFAPNAASENSNNGRVRASKMLFAEHWSRHGNGKELTAIESNNEANVDPRINLYYLYYNDARPELGTGGSIAMYPQIKVSSNDEQSWPYIKKYWYDAYTGVAEVNFIAYRYADLLLVRAEAANALGESDRAVGYVNMILDRAADVNGNGVRDLTEVMPAQWATGMSQPEVESELRYERAFELVGEGQEMFELRRHGKEYMVEMLERVDYWNNMLFKPIDEGGWGFTTVKISNKEIFYSTVINDDFIKKNLFFPYPAKEIQYNDGIDFTDQNFGWEN